MTKYFQGIINRQGSQQDRTDRFEHKADLMTALGQKGLQEDTKITILEINQKVVDHFTVKVKRSFEREAKQ